MKKLLAISLSLAMLLMTVACGSNNAGEPSSSEGSSYEDVLNPNVNTEDSTNEPDGDVQEPSSTDENDASENGADQNTSGGNSTNTGSTSKPQSSTGSTTQKPAGNSKPSTGSSSNTGSTSKPQSSSNYSGTLPDLINAIYAKQPVELMVTDPTAVNLSDADAVNNYLGLKDASKVKEAYYSEAMIGSQAYSLVVVRTKSAADAPSVAQSMFDGINQSKWICVTADALAVGSSGDTVMLAMVNSELGATLHTDLRAAYASVVGGKLDVSLDRVGTK